MAAGIAYGATALLPIAGAVAGIYIGADLTPVRVIVGAAVSVGSVGLAARIARRAPWRTIVAHRLRSYEQPNPTSFVELLLAVDDAPSAYPVLRRAHFNPTYEAPVGQPPDDAPDLTARIGVYEPEAWVRSTSDEDRLRRIATALAAADIRARVVLFESFPGGRVERRQPGLPAREAA
jgi:hypothetical protein